MPRISAPPGTPGPTPQAALIDPRDVLGGVLSAAEEHHNEAPRRLGLLETLTPLEKNTEYLNALYFGQEGTGKTTALAMMANLPGDGVVIIVNAEAGLKTGALTRMGIDTSKILLWPPDGSAVKINYANLEKLQLRAAQQLRDKPGSIKGIGFDSLTEVATALLEGAVARGIEKAANSDRKTERGDEFDVEQADWGIMTSQVKTLLRRFRDLPCHFGATALERTFAAKHGDSDLDQIGPDLNPGLAGKVLGFFDLCLRVQAETLFTGKGESETLVKAWTKKTKLIRAKDRENVLPASLPEPGFDRLLAYVRGELTADQDPGFAAHSTVRQRASDYQATKIAERKTPSPKEK